MAQRSTAPPERIIAAGPLARVARPRKTPKRKEVKEVEEVNEVKERSELVGAVEICDCVVVRGTRCRRFAAKTIAMVSMAAKGMSVAAAWEKPIMPTVVGSKSRSQRAVSAPYRRKASQARASVARSAEMALGRRAEISLTPKNLKLSAAPQ